MRGKRFMTVPVFVSISLLSSYTLLAQKAAPSQSARKLPKVCVAAVGNGSLKPIFADEVKEKLMNDLLAAGVNAESTSSATLVAKRLEISGNNRDSISLRKCDFMLLTAVDSAKPKGASPESSAGTPGGTAGSELLLSFALYQTKVQEPIFDTSAEAPEADTPTHAILAVVNQEVDRVVNALAKK